MESTISTGKAAKTPWRFGQDVAALVDFLCQLPGSAVQPGPILAVEYKGADRWNGAEDDRLIGGLWATLSEGRCRFVMVKDKRWDWVEEKLK
jgi:type III restriction enzyme